MPSHLASRAFRESRLGGSLALPGKDLKRVGALGAGIKQMPAMNDGRNENAEPHEGRSVLLFPLRSGAGDQSARCAGGDGAQEQPEVRLVRRRDTFSSVGPTFGQRITVPYAEKSCIRFVAETTE